MLIAKIKTIGFATILALASTGIFWGVYQMDATGAAPISVTQVARGQDVPREQRKDGEKKAADFFGMIKAIDLKVGTLTVQSLKDGDTNDVTFNLGSKELKVDRRADEALSSRTTVGLRVHLQLRTRTSQPCVLKISVRRLSQKLCREVVIPPARSGDGGTGVRQMQIQNQRPGVSWLKCR